MNNFDKQSNYPDYQTDASRADAERRGSFLKNAINSSIAAENANNDRRSAALKSAIAKSSPTWDYQSAMRDAWNKRTIPQPVAPKNSAPKNNAREARYATYDDAATKVGLVNRDAVKAWQQANGLTADGLFGKESQRVWKEKNTVDNSVIDYLRSFDKAPAQKQNWFSALSGNPEVTTFANNGTRRQVRFDPSGIGDYIIDEDGNTYELDAFRHQRPINWNEGTSENRIRLKNLLNKYLTNGTIK